MQKTLVVFCKMSLLLLNILAELIHFGDREFCLNPAMQRSVANELRTHVAELMVPKASQLVNGVEHQLEQDVNFQVPSGLTR